jgi:hypothetical protein
MDNNPYIFMNLATKITLQDISEPNNTFAQYSTEHCYHRTQNKPILRHTLNQGVLSSGVVMLTN